MWRLETIDIVSPQNQSESESRILLARVRARQMH